MQKAKPLIKRTPPPGLCLPRRDENTVWLSDIITVTPNSLKIKPLSHQEQGETIRGHPRRTREMGRQPAGEEKDGEPSGFHLDKEGGAQRQGPVWGKSPHPMTADHLLFQSLQGASQATQRPAGCAAFLRGSPTCPPVRPQIGNPTARNTCSTELQSLEGRGERQRLRWAEGPVTGCLSQVHPSCPSSSPATCGRSSGQPTPTDNRTAIMKTRNSVTLGRAFLGS